MAQVELIMPKMGESIMEATILKWLKKEGDTVEADEAVLEIATDKVDSEVPAPEGGVVSKILFEEGETIEVGKAIAVINTEGEEAEAPQGASPEAQQPEPESEPRSQAAAQIQETVHTAQATATTASPATNGSQSRTEGRFYSPLVLNIAREEGIPMQELEQIPGSGKDDRVTKKDILAYVKQREEQPTANAQTASQPKAAPQSQTQQSYNGNVEIIEMDRMRKMIAEHMVRSKHTSPHVTSFVEADVTKLVQWRNKNKNEFQEREGEKLTFTPLFIEAVIKAIKDYPLINSSVDGDKIIRKKDINIGMAVALPNFNLIVPVIRNADEKNLVGLSKKVNDLAARARDNKLKPDEVEGGTFTLTNVGTFGNVMGTPIISQPQVAILATGAIKKKPVVIETPQGDTIAIRHMMFLSLSYDHRIIDGALGGAFVRKVADYMEQFDENRTL